MTKMLVFLCAGSFIGMVFGVALAQMLNRPDLSPAPLALFIAIGSPSGGLIGSILGAISIFQEEMDRLHREMRRWRKIEELIEEIKNARSSTQFKSGAPDRD